VKRWLALLALLSGCGSSSLVYVDERFTPEEEAMIQEAADVWPVQIDLVFGQKVTAYHTDRRTVVKTDLHVIRHVLNEYDISPAAVTIAGEQILVAMDRMWHFTPILAHEFGHQLGVHHTEVDVSALMFPTLGDATRLCISKADADAYRAGTGGQIPVTCSSESSP
jgi:hypothetical protein